MMERLTEWLEGHLVLGPPPHEHLDPQAEIARPKVYEMVKAADEVLKRMTES